MSIIGITGTLTAKKAVPILFRVNSVSSHESVNNKDTVSTPPPTAGSIISGTGYDNGIIQLDSITTSDIKKRIELNRASRTITDMISALKFHDKVLKTGDTLQQSVTAPIPSPLAGGEYNIKWIYKLLKISNGVAEFDVFNTVSLNNNGNISQVKLTAGSGKGNMQYDIANSFIISLNDSLQIEFVIPFDKMAMKYTVNSDINYQVAISKK